jgi:hypothetical protein
LASEDYDAPQEAPEEDRTKLFGLESDGNGSENTMAGPAKSTRTRKVRKNGDSSAAGKMIGYIAAFAAWLVIPVYWLGTHTLEALGKEGQAWMLESIPVAAALVMIAAAWCAKHIGTSGHPAFLKSLMHPLSVAALGIGAIVIVELILIGLNGNLASIVQ